MYHTIHYIIYLIKFEHFKSHLSHNNLNILYELGMRLKQPIDQKLKQYENN